MSMQYDHRSVENASGARPALDGVPAPERGRPLTLGRLMLLVALVALLFSVNVPTAKMVLWAEGSTQGFPRLVTIWVVETVLCYYVILAGYILATWVPIRRAVAGQRRLNWRGAVLRYGG